MPGNTSKRYPPELKERAVRMFAEIRSDHETDWAALSRGSRSYSGSRPRRRSASGFAGPRLMLGADLAGEALVIDLPVVTARALAEYTPPGPTPSIAPAVRAKPVGTTANPLDGTRDGSPDATAVTS